MSLADSLYLKKDGGMSKIKARAHTIQFAKDSDCCIIANATPNYWFVNPEGTILFDGMATLYGFPFELIPASPDTSVESIPQHPANHGAPIYYSPSGIPYSSPQKGINIMRTPDGMVKKMLHAAL